MPGFEGQYEREVFSKYWSSISKEASAREENNPTPAQEPQRSYRPTPLLCDSVQGFWNFESEGFRKDISAPVLNISHCFCLICFSNSISCTLTTLMLAAPRVGSHHGNNKHKCILTLSEPIWFVLCCSGLSCAMLGIWQPLWPLPTK